MISDLVWIAEASRQTGASVKAIRLYESLGLIQLPRHAGYRYFDPASLEVLRCIKLAQTLGFSLKELQALVQADGQWDIHGFSSAIALKRQGMQKQMDDLQECMCKLDTLAQDVQNPDFCDQHLTGG